MREPGADCLVVAEQFPWSQGGRSPSSGWSQRATGGTPCLGGSRQASSGWHEPDESRDSRPDLWGTRGANPRVYPAMAPAPMKPIPERMSSGRRIRSFMTKESDGASQRQQKINLQHRDTSCKAEQHRGTKARGASVFASVQCGEQPGQSSAISFQGVSAASLTSIVELHYRETNQRPLYSADGSPK